MLTSSSELAWETHDLLHSFANAEELRRCFVRLQHILEETIVSLFNGLAIQQKSS